MRTEPLEGLECPQTILNVPLLELNSLQRTVILLLYVATACQSELQTLSVSEKAFQEVFVQEIGGVISDSEEHCNGASDFLALYLLKDRHHWRNSCALAHD